MEAFNNEFKEKVRIVRSNPIFIEFLEQAGDFPILVEALRDTSPQPQSENELTQIQLTEIFCENRHSTPYQILDMLYKIRTTERKAANIRKMLATKIELWRSKRYNLE